MNIKSLDARLKNEDQNNFTTSIIQNDERQQQQQQQSSNNKTQDLLKLISNKRIIEKDVEISSLKGKVTSIYTNTTSAILTKKFPKDSQNATKTKCNSSQFITFFSFTFLIVYLVSCTFAEVKFDQKQQVTTSTKRRKQDERINLVDADENGIYLVGLFDLHQSDSRAPLKCGRMELDAGETNSRRAMQNYEAFLWAIEQVNADKSLLPGIRLGSLALDTCSSVLRSNQQLANLLHEEHNSSLSSLLMPSQVAAIIADQADWLSLQGTLEMGSAQKITTFVTQSRSSKLASFALKYGTPTSGGGGGGRENTQRFGLSRPTENDAEPLIDVSLQDALEAQASQLDLGQPAASRLEREKLRELLVKKGLILGNNRDESEGEKLESNLANNFQLHMIRMPLGNELLAETLALLLQQMNWNFVSVIHEASEKISPTSHDRSDLYDLHEEFMRQILIRQLQLALDEEIPGNSKSLQGLLVSLAQKSSIGARVVVCLLSTGNSRRLLEALNLIRSSPDSSKNFLEALNSLVWITVADREPYYARAGDALGSIAISSAVPLIPEFKSHFEQLESEKRAQVNKWWPEYLRSILALEAGKATMKQQQQVALLKAECARNLQEASKSPAQEHCRSLSLAKLVEMQQRRQLTSSSGERVLTSTKGAEFSKYLAGGWEHNGMDVINSVLAVANGLEAVRQVLCPGYALGLCPEMRQLVWKEGPFGSSDEHHSLSELMYGELLRSSFQLADGRMFNLDELHSRGGAQLEGKFKLYNLRYLQANSVGFVRFGQFDQVEGSLELNSSKARYYPSASAGSRMKLMTDGQPLERVKSTCEDERHCLVLNGPLLTAANSASGGGPQVGSSASSSSSSMVAPISEAELVANMNTLFKLDHPALVTQESHSGNKDRRKSNNEESADLHIETMRSKMPFVNWNSLPEQSAPPPPLPHLKFNVIVLLPLHERSDASSAAHGEDGCGQMDIERSFQQLVALAYAQGQVNSAMLAALPEQEDSFSRIELTTTVIDYCEQPELARQKLARLLAEPETGELAKANGLPVAVIDFDDSISEQVEAQLANRKLLHLSLGSNSALTPPALPADSSPSSRPLKQAKQQQKRLLEERENFHLRLTASSRDEIKALVALVASMPNWRLVHLIYTDQQERGDEFVRLANEANICVSKLIWLPPNELEKAEEIEEQLDKTRRLFSREIHDYSAGSTGDTSGSSSSAIGDSSEGLNATRVLVLLASSNPLTNQLILEAASPSMREHYVWISSHEWFKSIELHHDWGGSHSAGNIVQQHLLPRLFLASKPESFESPASRAYLNSLSPAIHQPIPTRWFDEYWQQRFNCRLPNELAKSSATESGASSSAQIPLCSDPNFQAGPSVEEDDLSHQVIEVIEAIQASLLAGAPPEAGNASASDSQVSRWFSPERFARDVARALSLVRESRAFGHPLAHLPAGFQIIHRFSMAAQPAQGEQQQRRSNSRHLWSLDTDHTHDHLARVGLWRGGHLLFMKAPLGSNLNNNSTRHLWWLNQQQSGNQQSSNDDVDDKSSTSAGDTGDAAEQVAAEVSLAKLAGIQSRCLLPATCALCKLQLERAARILQETSSARTKQPSASSQLAGSDSPRFLYQQPANSAESPRPPSVATSRASGFRKSLDGDLSQASSQRQQQQHRWPIMGTPAMGQRRSWALLISAVCLVGVAAALAGSSYVKRDFPSPEDHTWMRHEPTSLSKQARARRAGSASSINDYFLLTGLLMLYSINVAFLLPATGAVCWLRRIGLTTSYTLIFTAILVRAVALWGESMYAKAQRQHLVQQVNLAQFKKRGNQQAARMSSAASKKSDPIEEGVELTFESLPQESVAPPQVIEEPDHHQHQQLEQQCSSNNNSNDQYEPATACCSGNACTANSIAIRRMTEPANLLAVALLLLLAQLAFSLIWSLEQPAEPTLYLGCWLCASPVRSPTLALYEPLLSFLYPALILLLPGWCFSLANFRLVTRKHQLQILAQAQGSRALLDHDNLNSMKLERREANSLIVSTTLLVLTWSVLALNMISFGNQQQGNQVSPSAGSLTTTSDNNWDLKRAPAKLLSECELSLVYANLISGAIIFSVLFVYRFNLIKHLLGKLNSKHTNNDDFTGSTSNLQHQTRFANDVGSASQSNHILKFNEAARSHSFTGSQFSPATTSDLISREQERLRLHQFSSASSTYSTYSPTSHTQLGFYSSDAAAAAAAAAAGVIKVNNRRSFTKSLKKRSKQSLFKKSPEQSSSITPEKSKSQLHLQQRSNSEFKLQRRQSANSVASSTAKLVASDQECDTISLGASSVASSSTSQVYGNELYPLDYSIQFDAPTAGNHQQPLQQVSDHSSSGSYLLNRSASFSRRSLRRSSMNNKLDAVREEQVTKEG